VLKGANKCGGGGQEKDEKEEKLKSENPNQSFGNDIVVILLRC
jgi:hypothetical protein